MKEYTKPRQSQTLFGLGFMETIPSPRLGLIRGIVTLMQFPNAFTTGGAGSY